MAIVSDMINALQSVATTDNLCSTTQIALHTCTKKCLAGAVRYKRFEAIVADLTAREMMVGEYATMGIYPRRQVMEFVRPTLGPNGSACL